MLERLTGTLVGVLILIIGLVSDSGSLLAEHPDNEIMIKMEQHISAVETALQDQQWEEAQKLNDNATMFYMECMPKFMKIYMHHSGKKGHLQVMHASAQLKKLGQSLEVKNHDKSEFSIKIVKGILSDMVELPLE